MCRYGTADRPCPPSIRWFHAFDSHVSRNTNSGGYSHQSENSGANLAITGCSRSLYSKTIASPSRAVMAAMCLPCGGLSSSIARPGRGGRHARIELENTKCLTPVPEAASSTFRRPTTLVLQYSGSSTPVKS